MARRPRSRRHGGLRAGHRFAQGVAVAQECVNKYGPRPDRDEPYFVVQNPGPGTRRTDNFEKWDPSELAAGEVPPRLLPVCHEVSVPMLVLPKALKHGLIPVRWAR